MISFKTQFDKLTRAYINDEVNPNANCACFVGNLLNGDSGWSDIRTVDSNSDNAYIMQPIRFEGEWSINSSPYQNAIRIISQESDNTYTAEEIVDIETVFLVGLYKLLPREVRKAASRSWTPRSGLECLKGYPGYEDALFTAFQAALDRLREIHISKGENVDEFVFVKRKLETA